MDIRTILSEAATLEHEAAGFVDTSKLATTVKAIAAHLLGTLPPQEQATIHTAAETLESVATVAEAVTPDTTIKQVEVAVGEAAQVVADATGPA